MTWEPHPAAAVWPMLPDDEMEGLADSIRSVGLLEPIVLWVDPVTGETLLLDGRNRARACEIAGVEPTTVIYDGDPVAYVLARNERRRHMTKGQRAMAAWLTVATLNDSTQADAARTIDVDKAMMTWARTVAEHAPDLAPVVVSGARPLKEAYDEARRRRDVACGEQARLARLPDDLASLVREDELTLTEAEASSAQRQRDRDERIARNVGYLTRISEGWQLALTMPTMTDLDAALEELPDHHRAHVDAVLALVHQEAS